MLTHRLVYENCYLSKILKLTFYHEKKERGVGLESNQHHSRNKFPKNSACFTN